MINIRNSGQLLSLLDGAVPGRDGRLRLPRDKHRHAANADRLNVNRMIKADRDMADIRHMRDRGVINNRLGSGNASLLVIRQTGIFNLLIDMAEKISGIKGKPDSKWSRS